MDTIKGGGIMRKRILLLVAGILLVAGFLTTKCKQNPLVRMYSLRKYHIITGCLIGEDNKTVRCLTL